MVATINKAVYLQHYQHTDSWQNLRHTNDRYLALMFIFPSLMEAMNYTTHSEPSHIDLHNIVMTEFEVSQHSQLSSPTSLTLHHV